MAISAWLKATVIWFGILILAILNGVLREKLLVPALSSFAGLMLSGVILSICIFFVAFIVAPWFGALQRRHWLWLGLFWLILTVGFEFSFGLFVQHQTWGELFDAYTYKDGNLWPLVLFTTFVSPWLAAKIRGLI